MVLIYDLKEVPMTSKIQNQPSTPRRLVLPMLLIGFGLGFILMRAFYHRPEWPLVLFYIALLLLAFIFALVFQAILHELGHLIGGLLSGYRFSSFRIMSFMVVRDVEGYRSARYWVPQTGGQCLLEPPDYDEGNFPYKLYNFAGPGINGLSAMLFFGLSFVVPVYPSLVLQILALSGLYLGFANGIPIKSDHVSNDGANVVTLGKSEAARKAFWTVLKANALLTQGVRLKDMPEGLFYVQRTQGNYLAAMQTVLLAERFMDAQDFARAAEVIDGLLAGNKVVGIQRTLLQADRIFIAVMQSDLELAETIHAKERDALKMMRKQLPVARTEYVLAKALGKAEAEGLLDEYNKLVEKHPYPAEVASEGELVALGEKIVLGEKTVDGEKIVHEVGLRDEAKDQASI